MPAVIVVCLLLFATIVALDILTPQRLVAAILLNVPVALSGLAFKRRFTFALVVAAIVADAVAGGLNAISEGGLDSISLFNRALLAASFALVGVMTVQLTQITNRLNTSKLEELRLRRERDRERIEAVGREPSLEAALQKASEVLCQSFEAQGALLVGAGVSELLAPRAAHPASLTSWPVSGQIPNRLIGAMPTQAIQSLQPGEYGLNANQAVIAGFEWPGHAPLLLAILEPKNSTQTLEELLPSLRDALERAELGQRLERNRNELGRRADLIRDLMYAFSHDMRTPLVANGVNMRLALEGAFGELPEKYRRTLVNGMQANEDLLALGDSMLLVAKLEAEQHPPVLEPLDFERAARASADRFPNASFEWKTRGETTVLGNPADLRRVIQNLLENAVKFSPQGSGIEVTLDSGGPSARNSGRESGQESVRLEVADRGAGVPVDLEPRLFQRFSSGGIGGGSGLGLYLARRIAEAHGGRIGYHPRTGGGSVFWLELPAAATAVLA